MALNAKDLNAQQQTMSARLTIAEANIAAQALSLKTLTALVSAIPGVGALTSPLTLMADLPGNMSSLLSAPGVSTFQSKALSLALGAIGAGIPSGVSVGAVADLQAQLDAAEAALAEALAAIPPDPVAIAQAQSAVDSASSAVATSAGALLAASNSAIGLITGSVHTPSMA